jgi:cell volume regulation protein A
MPQPEPTLVVHALLLLGALIALAVVLSRPAARFGIPLVLVFLGLGLLAGSEGLGGVDFEDYALSYRVGTVALVLIIFDGGLNTPVSTVRRRLAPALLLATVGVGVTAALVAAGAHFFGLSWTEAFLLGAVVSSTDAAAVFSALRGSNLQLDERVGGTLEVESGLNDPMAVILTSVLAAALVGEQTPASTIALRIAIELLVGAILGAALGYSGRWLIRRLRLASTGLYPVLTLGLALLTYGVASTLHGSGLLAVYVAGVALAAAPHAEHTRAREAILGAHDFAAWGAQIVMFIVLGLLAFPSRVWSSALPVTVPLPGPRNHLHRMGWTPRRHPDRAGHPPRPRRRPRRPPDLQRRLLRRRPERPHPGHHGRLARPPPQSDQSLAPTPSERSAHPTQQAPGARCRT